MNKIIEKCRVSTLLIYGHCLLLSSWLAAHSQCSDHAHVAIRHGGAAVPSTSIQMPAICLALQLPPRQSITKSIKRLKHAMLSVASRCRWRCRRPRSSVVLVLVVVVLRSGDTANCPLHVWKMLSNWGQEVAQGARSVERRAAQASLPLTACRENLFDCRL